VKTPPDPVQGGIDAPGFFITFCALAMAGLNSTKAYVSTNLQKRAKVQ